MKVIRAIILSAGPRDTKIIDMKREKIRWREINAVFVSETERESGIEKFNSN